MRRQQPLKRGYCRLCWCQAALERPTGPDTPLAPYVAKVAHQQLFLAGMSRRRAAPRAFARRYGAKGPPAQAATACCRAAPAGLGAAAAVRRGPPWLSLRPRRLRRGPAPDNPWLAWALHLAYLMAEARGFDPIVWRTLNRNLVMLLADYSAGEVLRTSDFSGVVRDRCASLAHTIEILQVMGIPCDDRPQTFEQWLVGKLDGLAPSIGWEVQRWARTLRDGGPRTRARKQGIVQSYLRVARPALLVWSARYQHLRQVTRADVVAYLDTLHGERRLAALVALRSLFSPNLRGLGVGRGPLTGGDAAR